MKLFYSLILSLMVMISYAHVFADDQWSYPFSGISYLHRTGANQLSAHAVVVDLCTPGVGVRHTAFSERGRTASSFAALTGAQVVINGDWSCRPIDVGQNSPFPPCQGLPSYHTYGIAAHAGEPWPSSWSRDGLLAFAAGRVEMYDYNEHKEYMPWMQEAMSGHFQLVRDGQVSYEAATGVASDRPPRSAIGLSEDRTQLILVTVDGRRNYIGMNEAEIATFLVEMGAHSAFGLDGGGSSTLWMQNQGVVNDPSDGTERIVGPHLGIYATGQGTTPYCDRPFESHPSRALPAIEYLGSQGGFYPRTPVRVYDTRNPTGSQYLVGLQRNADQKPIAQGTFSFSNFSAYSVPSNANAVAINLTVANQNAWGFVTAWPGHLDRPDTSNLNHGSVQAVANSALIHLNASQEMKLYSYASAQHIGDLTGWFAPEGAGFVPRTPLRILDSRSGNPILSQESRQIMAAPTDGATAVALGIVALSADSNGFLTVYPCDQTRPDTSTVNFAAHDVVSGSILVPTGPGGVCAYSYGESHILVDHYGSFIQNQGTELQAVRPIRLIDTRSTSGRWVGRVPHESVQQLNLSDIPNFPTQAQAIAVNLTAVDPAANGFAALGPCNNLGNGSSINYTEARTSSTTSVVKIENGSICLYVWGRTHILIDLVGIFVPPPDPCQSQPCVNGSSCISAGSDYRCECLAGFHGDHCELNINDCEGNPCQNGGHCIDGIAQFTCECPQGFSGSNCQTNVNDCDDNPCQNNGICVDEVNGYRCECQEAFSGTHCEINIDDCMGVTCENGGLCIDLVGDFRCDCNDGFEGEYCEIEMTDEADMYVPSPQDMYVPPPQDMYVPPASTDAGLSPSSDMGIENETMPDQGHMIPSGGVEASGGVNAMMGGASSPLSGSEAGIDQALGNENVDREMRAPGQVDQGCAQKNESRSVFSLCTLLLILGLYRRRLILN